MSTQTCVIDYHLCTRENHICIAKINWTVHTFLQFLSSIEYHLDTNRVFSRVFKFFFKLKVFFVLNRFLKKLINKTTQITNDSLFNFIQCVFQSDADILCVAKLFKLIKSIIIEKVIRARGNYTYRLYFNSCIFKNFMNNSGILSIILKCR